MDFWTIVTALAACVAAIGSLAAAWALYHTRMLDCNFMAEPSLYFNACSILSKDIT
jgi:predicted lysophospholipase L1 biosynthesis ABC-type transport system permease subunit